LPSLQERVAAFPYWYHKIELPGGIVTPGWAPINQAIYNIPADLTGKRILDVGAWDGYWTFEALKRGAREVIAIDDFSDCISQEQPSQRCAWDTFDLCREALGYSEDICQRIEMSVYEVSEDRLGRFDAIFCFGTLYHLRYPLLALDKLSAICNREFYLESAILDDYSPYQGGLGHGYPGKQMVMEFYPNQEYGNNPTNYWVPTLMCLANMVQAAGFIQVEAWKLMKEPTKVSLCRGFAKGRKVL
jgi:tRNA (mo5U34)-methyltransferase